MIVECGVGPDMPAQSRTQFVDRIIHAIARRQYGVVSRAQLLEEGVTRHEIATRIMAGRLTELHRGVYLVGAAVAPHSHEMGALLACGPRSVLSHRSAASLWDLLPYPAAATVWITVPPGQSTARPRIKVIRTPLDRRDIRDRNRLRLTSPPRTILDMAAELVVAGSPSDSEGHYELEHLVAEAQFRRLASDKELRDQLERNARKPGVVALRSVLDLRGGPKRTRSKGERAMLRLLRQHRIDGFEVNVKVHGYEVDFLWPEEKLVVELDGYDGHSGRVAFERDRMKWAKLSARGLSVMHATGRQVRRDPDGVLERLSAARRARG